MLMVIAMFCMLFDLTRHLLVDSEVLPLYMFTADPETGDMILTGWGWAGMLLTWAGAICLVASIVWYSDIVRKLQQTCHHTTRLIHEKSLLEEEITTDAQDPGVFALLERPE